MIINKIGPVPIVATREYTCPPHSYNPYLALLLRRLCVASCGYSVVGDVIELSTPSPTIRFGTNPPVVLSMGKGTMRLRSLSVLVLDTTLCWIGLWGILSFLQWWTYSSGSEALQQPSVSFWCKSRWPSSLVIWYSWLFEWLFPVMISKHLSPSFSMCCFCISFTSREYPATVSWLDLIHNALWWIWLPSSCDGTILLSFSLPSLFSVPLSFRVPQESFPE